MMRSDIIRLEINVSFFYWNMQKRKLEKQVWPFGDGHVETDFIEFYNWLKLKKIQVDQWY